jgi:hypothetical protein
VTLYVALIRRQQLAYALSSRQAFLELLAGSEVSDARQNAAVQPELF